MARCYISGKVNIILTHDENDLVDFILEDQDYLRENIIEIHPAWNMQIWSRVLERQMQLNQIIPQAVMKKYAEYKNKKNKIPSWVE